MNKVDEFHKRASHSISQAVTLTIDWLECACDPPGAGEQCTGHCVLRAENARLTGELARSDMVSLLTEMEVRYILDLIATTLPPGVGYSDDRMVAALQAKLSVMPEVKMRSSDKSRNGTLA